MDPKLRALQTTTTTPFYLPTQGDTGIDAHVRLQAAPPFGFSPDFTRTGFEATFSIEPLLPRGASIEFEATPEPTTLLLFGTTAAGLGLARWRQRRRKRES